jgi:hypothetical protein
MYLPVLFLCLCMVVLSACGATAVQVIPTDLPTITPTLTATVSRTPGGVPTMTPTSVAVSPTGGPSPTSLFGPTRTPASIQPTPTRVVNPNAPRIEFFTSDVTAASPGSSITLFWSTRNTTGATIYRLDTNGQRNQLWNVPPDGSLAVPTRRSDRGEVDFVLSTGEGTLIVESELSIPLACPDQWFFVPAPPECPTGPTQPTSLTEEFFERGRMIYIQQSNTVYALFNDGFDPAWVAFENRYDPAVHPEIEERFVPPPGLYQPIGKLGFVWRGRDLVRNRLGLAAQPEIVYEGSLQTATLPDGGENLYVSSADGSVLQLLPDGEAWQIIAAP